MVDLDITNPEDTDVVSQFPSNERDFRAAVLSLTNGTSTWGGTSGGSANAQTVTISNTGWSLAAGAAVDFIAGFSNTTTTPTLKVNSTTAKTVKQRNGDALTAGDIESGTQHRAIYDGTDWRLQDPAVSRLNEQATYDFTFPVGRSVWSYTAEDPNDALPPGVTATWTAIAAASATLIALDDSASVAATTGSFTTGAGSAHSHGAGTIKVNASTNVEGGGSRGGFGGTGNVTASGTTDEESSHTHTIDPKRLILRAWRRTA